MRKIVLFTSSSCPKCPQAEKVLFEAVSLLGLVEGRDYEIKCIDDVECMLEALRFQVASTPAFLVDGEVVFKYKIPSVEDIKEEILK